jgi:filamentous hemagglutinin family protein
MQKGCDRVYQFGLISLFALLGGVVGESASAQITPDETLGEERSVVTPDFLGTPNEAITGGARRGQNLFHSFREFNVDAGRGAYFLTPDAAIENVLARVTGVNPSEILGVLGMRQAGSLASTNANLFLLNPNGILFGPGARLDVGGSFVATTADAIGFGEQGFFSASSPEAPSGLLAIDPSAFFFNQLSDPASIINQSVARFPADPAFIDGLRVSNGGSLLLLGGEIQLQNSKLSASSGRVELGAVTDGTVGLTIDENVLDLSFPSDLLLGNIFLSGSVVDASGIQSVGTVGGEIQLQADQITLINSSVSSNNFSNQPNGAISLQANLLDSTNSSILTNTFASGNGGNINVDANTINLRDRGGISTFSRSQGSAGNIDIQSTGTISLSNQANINSAFGGFLLIRSGSPGNVSVTAGNLNIQNAGILVTTLLGEGASGNLTLQADSSINLNRGSLITSSLGNGSSGQISINTRDLTLTNGSGIYTSAIDPALLSTATLDPRISSLFSPEDLALIRQLFGGVQPGIFGQGDSGDIAIVARGSIQAANSSTISTLTIGQGQGGNINVMADTISSQTGGRFIAETSGQGNAGSVTIQANDRISFDGVSSTGFKSGISSSVNAISTASGIREAGAITIEAGTLTLANGALISGNVEAGATGVGSNIVIRADSLSLDSGSQIQSILRDADTTNGISGGRGATGNIDITVSGDLIVTGRGGDGFSSGIFTRAGTGTEGNAGDIIIRATSLNLNDTGTINSSTSSQGNGGTLDLEAQTINLTDDALISAETFGQGRGGDVTITAIQLLAQNGGQISAGSGRQGIPGNFGRGGNVTVTVTDQIELDGVGNLNRSGIFAETSSPSRAGDVTINTGRLIVRNGAAVSAGASGSGSLGGDGGDLTVNATESIEVIGQGSGRNSAIVAEASGIGNAGKLFLITDRLNVRGGARVTTSTLGRGNAGDISIRANSINLSGGLIFSTIDAGAIGNAGDISIQTNSLTLSRGGQIATSVTRGSNALPGGRGRGGRVEINASDFVTIAGIGPTGFSTGIFANTQRGASGRAGDIEISTGRFNISDGAVVTSQTLNSSNAGDITINANSFEATGGGQIVNDTRSDGRAGNITLNVSGDVVLSGSDPNYANRFTQFPDAVVANFGPRSGLFASTAQRSRGGGGSITLNTTDLSLTDRARISARSDGTGIAGDIEINASGLLEATNSDIETIATNSSGGDIDIQADRIQLNGDGDIRTNSNVDGGNITLSASSILALGDSDIIASAGKQGGDITLNTPAYFGENYQFDTTDANPDDLENNDRADINATGAQPGVITTPDTTFIQNSLTELPETAIDADSLVANSCVVRSREQTGTFTITGGGGLPQRPGDLSLPSYPTGPVQSVEETDERSWQPGAAIVEPQGVYQLDDGRMVLSRECE